MYLDHIQFSIHWYGTLIQNFIPIIFMLKLHKNFEYINQVIAVTFMPINRDGYRLTMNIADTRNYAGEKARGKHVLRSKMISFHR